MINAVYMVLACVGAAQFVGVWVAWPWLRRRFRRPQACRAVLAASSGAVALASFGCAVSGRAESQWVGFATAAGGAAILAAAVGWVLNHHIAKGGPVVHRRVLAIGAHPDDLELACGGTIAKLADGGHEVRAMVMSNGQVGGEAALRHEAAHRGATLMGAAGVELAGLPDTRLAEFNNEMVVAIEAAIRRFNPDLILTHSGNDQHQDHQAVHLATLRAARRHSSILCFESPSATRAFDPSVFIDIEDHLEVKVSAVSEHTDQAGKPYMTAQRVRSVAAFRGAQSRRDFAEGFEPVRLLDTAGEAM